MVEFTGQLEVDEPPAAVFELLADMADLHGVGRVRGGELGQAPMRKSKYVWVSMLMSVLVVVSACGGDTGEAATTATAAPRTTTLDSPTTTVESVPDDAPPTVGLDPALAESCAELVEMTVESHQQVLDAMGGEVFEDEMPPEVEAAVEDAFEFVSQLAIAEELCDGGFAEFDQLRCERSKNLETFGLDWETYLNQIFPPCELDANS